MSRFVELANEKIRAAERANGANVGIAIRDLCQAVRLLAEAVDVLEERIDEHTGAEDAHRRLI